MENAANVRAMASRSMSRTMNTMRVRRSSVGHASSRSGLVYDRLHGVYHIRLAVHVDDSFHAQQMRAAVTREHAEPRREARGAYGAVVIQREGIDFSRVSCRVRSSSVAGGGAQPSLDVGTRAAAPEECRRVYFAMAHRDDLGARIDLLRRGYDLGLRLRSGEIGLREQQNVRNDDLLAHFGMRGQLRQRVNRVDHADHAVEAVQMAQIRIADDRLHDGHRIGEARRLDEHAVVRGDFSFRPLDRHVGQRLDEVALDLAAEAAVLEQPHVLRRRRDEEVIDTDLAELVDDDEAVAEALVLKKAIEQRSLAAAQKARRSRQES